jgi:pimeloyl-ACP methyl ester carboxylesterase
MAAYVLIHGAGSDSAYWYRVVPELERRGHEVVTPDLPSEDDRAAFVEYADVVVDAISDPARRPRPLIVVAQSLAGFTAPLVADRVPTDLIVLVEAMVPKPGEAAGEWWDNTDWRAARAAVLKGRDFDVMEDFFHDVPPEVTAEVMARGERRQSDIAFADPWPLDRWPDVATRFLLCRDDRFFPADFQRRVVKERLGLVPDEMDGGHLPALARPHELVQRLEAYRAALASTR